MKLDERRKGKMEERRNNQPFDNGELNNGEKGKECHFFSSRED